MGSDRLRLVSSVAELVEPPDPREQALPLFASNNYELFHDIDGWDARQQRLLDAQREAVLTIWLNAGLSGVASFAERADLPFAVGWALSATEIPPLLREDLVALLSPIDSKRAEFAAGYVSNGEHSKRRPLTVDFFDGWQPDTTAWLLSALRTHSPVVWDIADRVLGPQVAKYWRLVDGPIVDDPVLLHRVSNSLINAGRPLAAIRSIYFYAYKNGVPNVDDAERALMAAVSTDEQPHANDAYEITTVITLLQKSSIDPDKLARIEWSYLQLLSGPERGAPLTLERRLAESPPFFCEVIRTVFRSDNSERTPEPTEAARNIASNAFSLLFQWSIPPGMSLDGSFDGARFSYWLAEVEQICRESGHLTVALHQVGPVLTHVPPDTSGLWINRQVAQEMNRADMEELRSGYRTGLFNSRGVHWVDPSGAPERELASRYGEWAEQADRQGFARLAGAMRALSESYALDAERIRISHFEGDS
jgi:hypothetical protein